MCVCVRGNETLYSMCIYISLFISIMLSLTVSVLFAWSIVSQVLYFSFILTISFFPSQTLSPSQFYYAQYNFGGSDSTQLNLVAGQVVLVVFAESHEWWFVEDRHGHQGYVPASYLTPYT